MAGLLVYAWFLWKGEKTPGLSSIGKISVGGVLMLVIGTGSVAWAQQYIASGLAAIIVASTPLWFVLLDKREWQSNFNNGWVLLGLLIGFAGIVLLVANSNGASTSASAKMKLISCLLLVAGTISWAAGSLYTKYKSIDTSTGMKAAFQMITAGIIAIAASAVRGEFHQFSVSAIQWQAVVAMLYLIIMGSIVAYMAYVWLLTIRSATLVGTYAYVNPVVAVFLGWLIADEVISGKEIIALTIILGAVVMVTLAKTLRRVP